MSATKVAGKSFPRGYSTAVDDRRDEIVAVTIAGLVATKEKLGYLPSVEVKRVAKVIGVTPRQVQRKVEKLGTPDGRVFRAGLDDPEVLKDLVYLTFGNVTAAYKIAQAKVARGELRVASTDPSEPDLPMPDLRTMQRRVVDLVPAIHRECAQYGLVGLKRLQQYLSREEEEPGSVYAIDHSYIGVPVVAERGTDIYFPWMTTVMDEGSRVILACILWGPNESPNVEKTVEAITTAVLGHTLDDGTFIGGKPEFLRSDNGSDLVGYVATKGLIRAGIGRIFSAPYESHQNGKVERLHRTIKEGFFSTLPGYVANPNDIQALKASGVTLGKDAPLTTNATQILLNEWIHTFNAHRPHKGIGSRIPFNVWKAADPMLERATDAELSLALTKSDTRVVRKSGVTIDNVQYRIRNLPNETRVEVRLFPGRTDAIVVIADGQKPVLAYEIGHPDGISQGQIIGGRQKQHREAIVAQLNAQREREIAVIARQIAAGVPAEEVSELSPLPVEAEATEPDAADDTQSPSGTTGVDPGDSDSDSPIAIARASKTRGASSTAAADELRVRLSKITAFGESA